MLLQTPLQCETAIPPGDANRAVFLECMRTVGDGGYFRYDPAPLDFSAEPLFAVGAFLLTVAYLVAVATALSLVAGNTALARSQKWGFAIGLVLALPLFLPLYLIFAPLLASKEA